MINLLLVLKKIRTEVVSAADVSASYSHDGNIIISIYFKGGYNLNRAFSVYEIEQSNDSDMQLEWFIAWANKAFAEHKKS